MGANLSGLERLRAKVPTDRRTASRSGSNGPHTSNDIGVIWPVEKPAIMIAAYITQCFGPEHKRSGILAEIERLELRLSPSTEEQDAHLRVSADKRFVAVSIEIKKIANYSRLTNADRNTDSRRIGSAMSALNSERSARL
jgi:hypothetical protein